MFTPFAFVKSATVPVTPFSGILDSYPSASGAWSVRRLSSTYTGNILTVRRASDNTTQNISYTANGDLDTTSLSSFCAGTLGYVTTLYDQSGNGVNLTQAADTRQPLIYSGSTIVKGPNNEPSMYFDGVGTHLSGSYGSNSDSYMSAFAVTAPFDTGSNWCMYAQSLNSTQPPAFGLIDRDIFLDFMWGAGQEASYTPNTTNLAVKGAIRKAATTQNTVYFNNTAGSTTTTLTDVTIGPIVTLGCIFGATNGGDGTFPYKGWISEMIVWRTDQTSNVSGIDTNMGDYYGI